MNQKKKRHWIWKFLLLRTLLIWILLFVDSIFFAGFFLGEWIYVLSVGVFVVVYAIVVYVYFRKTS